MRCQFCHNPDSWSCEGGEVMTVDELLDRAWRFHSYWGKDGCITVSAARPASD
jgi:pyruvate formate lyase activating enzyme